MSAADRAWVFHSAIPSRGILAGDAMLVHGDRATILREIPVEECDPLALLFADPMQVAPAPRLTVSRGGAK